MYKRQAIVGRKIVAGIRCVDHFGHGAGQAGLAGGAGGAHIRARHNVHAIGRCCDRKLRFCVARHIKVAGARYEVRRGDLDDKRRGTGFRWIAADGNFCVGIIRLADRCV